MSTEHSAVKDHELPAIQEAPIDNGQSIATEESSLQKIIEEAEKSFNLDELKKLKPEEGAKRYLEEGKRQITSLCQCIDSLSFRTEVHTVTLNIKLGEILNEIKEWCDNNKGFCKGGFSAWVKDSFEDKHSRYFYQARQMAAMGEQAYRYAYLGKNRLLEFESIRKSINEKEQTQKTLDDVFNSQPFNSSNGDGDNNSAAKRHVDALITFHRFKNEEVKAVEFQRAVEMVSLKRGAVTVSIAKQVKNVLDGAKNDKQKREYLGEYIKDKMNKFPANLHSEVIRKSPDTMFNNLTKYCDDIDFNDQGLMERVKGKIKKESLIKAYKRIKMLAEKLEIDLNQEEIVPDSEKAADDAQ